MSLIGLSQAIGGVTRSIRRPQSIAADARLSMIVDKYEEQDLFDYLTGISFNIRL